MFCPDPVETFDVIKEFINEQTNFSGSGAWIFTDSRILYSQGARREKDGQLIDFVADANTRDFIMENSRRGRWSFPFRAWDRMMNIRCTSITAGRVTIFKHLRYHLYFLTTLFKAATNLQKRTTRSLRKNSSNKPKRWPSRSRGKSKKPWRTCQTEALARSHQLPRIKLKLLRSLNYCKNYEIAHKPNSLFKPYHLTHFPILLISEVKSHNQEVISRNPCESLQHELTFFLSRATGTQTFLLYNPCAHLSVNEECILFSRINRKEIKINLMFLLHVTQGNKIISPDQYINMKLSGIIEPRWLKLTRRGTLHQTEIDVTLLNGSELRGNHHLTLQLSYYIEYSSSRV